MRFNSLIAAAAMALAIVIPAQAVTPNPVATGPVPVRAVPGDPSHDYPFFSTNVDLAANGYVEEEYFFEGDANTYTIGDPLSTAVVNAGAPVPYRTRMSVRRPNSAADFNGTVIVEWQNNALGFDVDALWIQSSQHLMRRGYA